jgi:hypothetical protein
MDRTVFYMSPGEHSRYSDSLRAGPASYTVGTGSFPRAKRPGRGVDHPPQSSAEAKEILPVWTFLVCSGVDFIFTAG